MIRSHLLNLVLSAAFLAVAFGLLSEYKGKERFRYGLKLFAIMTVGTIALAWVMYPFT